MNQKFSERSVPLVSTKAFQDGSVVIASRESLREEDRASSPIARVTSGTLLWSCGHQRPRAGSSTAWLSSPDAGHGGAPWACRLLEGLTHTKASDSRSHAPEESTLGQLDCPVLIPTQPLDKLLTGSQSSNQEAESPPAINTRRPHQS